MDRSADVVALFPGQGAFDGQALSAAAANHSDIRDVFHEIDEVTRAETGRRLSDVVLAENPPRLAELLADEPWVSQLAIYGTDVAVHRVLRDNGLRPDLLVGHSLGEIAALVCADAYTVADGARLIWHRVRVVNEAELRDGCMAALATDPDRAQSLLAAVADDDLVIAAANHDRQTVVSGPNESMAKLRSVADAVGVSFARLESPAPFHSPLLRPTVERFSAAIRDIPRQALRTPVHSPILNRKYTDDEDIAAALASHFTLPVNFATTIRQLADQGVRHYVECGAVGALSKFVRQHLNGSAPTAIAGLPSDPTGIHAALGALREAGLLPVPQAANGNRTGFDAFWADRGTQIIELIRREFEIYHGSRTGPEAAAEAGHAVDPAEVADRLRKMYSDALEYPEEVFADDVELEAELGIDSVKQVELLTRVSETFGLPTPTDGFRLADYDRMGKVVDYTVRLLSRAESAHA
ncbi:acyltransferase domain-containing protein [Saccharopolyspora sp. K220]|uniref:acyltransferase domain-containing protein n=1 Tax=Saccharopolyspora soli TaxID=2926618 RepID=UPI001F58524C|nr:acyltransferase domain-containing protein [Saccharopolyspora soli]MCI2416140.1 acyltransferase domain-containing protein [Saccharopolyspora soli]